MSFYIYHKNAEKRKIREKLAYNVKKSTNCRCLSLMCGLLLMQHFWNHSFNEQKFLDQPLFWFHLNMPRKLDTLASGIANKIIATCIDGVMVYACVPVNWRNKTHRRCMCNLINYVKSNHFLSVIARLWNTCLHKVWVGGIFSKSWLHLQCARSELTVSVYRHSMNIRK
jgi:hypothetical protein